MPIETALERPLPHNVDAERSILGAILLDNHALNIAIEKTPLERYVPPAKPSLVGLTRAALGEALTAIGVPPAQVKTRATNVSERGVESSRRYAKTPQNNAR